MSARDLDVSENSEAGRSCVLKQVSRLSALVSPKYYLFHRITLFVLNKIDKNNSNNNSKCLHSSYFVPGTVTKFSVQIHHLILTAQWDKYYCHPHFTDKNTETQIQWITCQRSQNQQTAGPTFEASCKSPSSYPLHALLICRNCTRTEFKISRAGRDATNVAWRLQ